MTRLCFIFASCLLTSCSTMNLTNICVPGHSDDLLDSTMTQDQNADLSPDFE